MTEAEMIARELNERLGGNDWEALDQLQRDAAVRLAGDLIDWVDQCRRGELHV